MYGNQQIGILEKKAPIQLPNSQGETLLEASI